MGEILKHFQSFFLVTEFNRPFCATSLHMEKTSCNGSNEAHKETAPTMLSNNFAQLFLCFCADKPSLLYTHDHEFRKQSVIPLFITAPIELLTCNQLNYQYYNLQRFCLGSSNMHMTQNCIT